MSNKAQIIANRIECVKPRRPKGCEYGIPKLNVITSKSGSIVDNIAKRDNHLVCFNANNSTKVAPTIL